MRILKIAVVTIILVVAISIIFSYNENTKTNVESYEADSYFYNGKENMKCLYYDEKDFVNIIDFEVKDSIGSIHGCILPHHLTASDLIHEVFQNINKNDYDTVVLIGPDHESINKGKIFTTLNDWQTPMGILKTDQIITNDLLKNDFVIVNDEKLTIEHSTSSIIPFIKYYLEDANVVTLVLTKQTKLEDVDLLIESLYNSVNKEKTLFIASVDFSHYLNLNNANKMDLISMEAIQNKDINKIMSFTNDNLDSPVSIVTMLKMMDKLDSNNPYLLNHSNTELITKMKIEETTSYLTYLFYK